MLTMRLEAIANEMLRAAGLSAPVDAYDLCRWAGLRVVMGPEGTRPMLVGDVILVNGADPVERRRFAATHELAHRILRERGIEDTEWRVNWLASALLHPREWFMQVLAARGWDLAGLKIECPYSSHEAIARRVVNLRHAVLWVCDRDASGKRTSQRVCSRGVAPRLIDSPTVIERAAVRAAALERRAQSRAFVHALPLERGPALRVICLSRADDLARAV
jgi:hypothetical protein